MSYLDCAKQRPHTVPDEAQLRLFHESLPLAGSTLSDAEKNLYSVVLASCNKSIEVSFPLKADIENCCALYSTVLDAADWYSGVPAPKAAAKALHRATSTAVTRHLSTNPTCVDILNASDENKAMNMLHIIYSLHLVGHTILTCRGGDMDLNPTLGVRDEPGCVASAGVNTRTKRAAVCDNLDITQPYEPRYVAKSPEIRRLLLSVVRHNVLFKNCSLEAHNAVVDAFESIEPLVGEIVIKYGDPGDYFYIVECGFLDVYVHQDSSTHEEVKTGRQLCRGDYFGELALMCNTPRAATVKVGLREGIATSLAEKCILWKIDRHMYRSIVSHFSKQMNDSFLGLISNVKIAGSRRLGSILSGNELNRLVSSLEIEEFEPNEVIVRQNTTGDYFYIIHEGFVDVYQKDNLNSVSGNELGLKVAELSRGDYFGEKSLLADDVRQASCVAAKPGPSGKVICLSLSRNDFIALLGSWQDIASATGIDTSPTTPDDTELHSKNVNKSVFEMTVSMDELSSLSTLGIGAFGKVRKVFHSSSGQYFALKYQSKSFIVSQGMQDAIVSEMKITRMLQHPCVAQLYSAFQDSKYVYFLLELLPGGDFFSFLQDSGQLSEDRCRFYAASVVSAFECIHGKNIAYRDLKPENMVLDANGYVKLVDFGLAKQILDGGNTWTMCGTPDYLAPEIVLNQGHDHAVDYWALGVLIYEIVNGLPPFYHENSLRIFEKIAAGKITFPDGLFSKQVEDLITKLLVKNPSRRIGNMKGKIMDIIKHKWFSSFDWNGLLAGTLRPAFVPPVMTSAQESDVMIREEKDEPVSDSAWQMDLS